MRTFTLGSGTGRRFVVLEVNGPRVAVIESKADGSPKRSEREWKSEAEARAACERMARELVSRGFVEQAASAPAKAKPVAAASKPAAASKSAARAPEPARVDLNDALLEEDEGPAVASAPLLPRLATAPGAGTATDAPKKKKKKSGGKKKHKKAGGSGGDLDKRVVAAVAAIGVGLVGLVGFLVYDIFLKPPTIVGTWKGSRTEHEISVSLTHTEYSLILDEQKNASMTIQNFTATGTYAVKGDRLVLNLKDEDGQTSERQYKIALGHTTLDLFDPTSGKKVVQLIRFREKPSIGGGRSKSPAEPAASKDLAALAAGEADKAADERLASVSFSPKDGAFKVRHPKGWEVETGSRPDNTYSWARFTKGSAKIQVFADVTGSLMSGSDIGRQHEEGSVAAPVHNAHVMYKKTASEQYSDYKESAPTLFKGSPLGEGRIASFSASGGGLFGSKLRGYRVTLLTNDRRVSILCESPVGEFEKLKPTFLAVCRSVSR
jgi:hypothetical protein